jgi:cytochrome oxidase Cu insertion factor (SCO1/SenC/PrrC family)
MTTAFARVGLTGVIALALTLCIVGPAMPSAETTTTPSAVFDLKVPDIPVVDQNGRNLRFYSDLVKGRTVAINFIFTTCTTICPQLTLAMRRTQEVLGQRVGRDVFLLSVSVDPARDTPERLRSFAAKFDAGPGWTFVTGRQADIDRLLKALGNAGRGSDHTTTVLIGNEPAGHWVRSSGLASVATNMKLIVAAADARSARRF